MKPYRFPFRQYTEALRQSRPNAAAAFERSFGARLATVALSGRPVELSTYWYAAELKEFAKRIGIPSATKLREGRARTRNQVFLETRQIRPLPNRSLSRREGCAAGS